MTIERVGVVGAGQLGSGIAEVAAKAGAVLAALAEAGADLSALVALPEETSR